MKILILLSLLLVSVAAKAELEVVYQWSEVSFVWPNETFKNTSIANGSYIEENNVPVGVAVWNDKVFLTIPRWFAGVAASLTFFYRNTTEKSPELYPYPSWDNHDIDNYSSEETLVNPVRPHIDSCNRMWFVDMGSNNFMAAPTRVANPSIVVIDLETDAIIRKCELDSSTYVDTSFFADVAIDINGTDCDNAYAYITDGGNAGIIVYSYAQNDSWVFTHNFMNFEPLAGNFWFQGFNFHAKDDVFGASLGSVEDDGYRTLYFHPFVSNEEFSVRTLILQNKTASEDIDYYSFKHEGHKGEMTSSTSSAFDEKTNTLIMGLPKQYAVGCWNPKKHLHPKNFSLIAQNEELIAFPSDVKVDSDRNLWVLTDKLPIFLFSSLNSTDTNFRILSAKLDDLIANTSCVVSS